MALWQKGQSGNPSGRPKANLEFIAKAREHSLEALALLVEQMRDPKLPPAIRQAAASDILDRGIGKPAQAVQLSGPDDGPIEYSQVTDADIAAAFVQFLDTRAVVTPPNKVN